MTDGFLFAFSLLNREGGKRLDLSAILYFGLAIEFSVEDVSQTVVILLLVRLLERL